MVHDEPSIILCADDFAIAPGVSRAIAALIGQGRLTATSCMTVSPFWPEHAAWLRPLADRADIGLHLTLTDQQPLGPMPRLAPGGRLPPLGSLMRQALAGSLDPVEIKAEVVRQVESFTLAFGAPPVFIDGHQHVHQLPTVRGAVVEVLHDLARTAPVYVRSCIEPVTAILRRGVAVPKTLLISQLGRGLSRLAARHDIPVNARFRGVYDFSNRIPFPILIERFLDRPVGRTLVMCHPGIPDDDLRRADPVTDQRAVEYDTLRGDAFGERLAAHGLRLARFTFGAPAPRHA